ncbi:MAG: heme ABC transporter ATP-binding protein [Panacagrimonas sp.]
MLRAAALGFRLDSRDLLRNVDLSVSPGEVLAVLGPNGAGKSTLLRLLARELRPTTGELRLNKKPLDDWSGIELARLRAVLPQAESLNFSFPVEQVVSLGRFPWAGESQGKAREIVRRAMHTAGVTHLADRAYTRLSGGERARVQFARVLAQIMEPCYAATRYLLLDEPTARLDLAYQHDVLATTRQIASTGVGVVVVLHDPNLALLYADRVLLLKDGATQAYGSPGEVLTVESIQAVFGLAVELIHSEGSATPWIVPRASAAARDHLRFPH